MTEYNLVQMDTEIAGFLQIEHGNPDLARIFSWLLPSEQSRVLNAQQVGAPYHLLVRFNKSNRTKRMLYGRVINTIMHGPTITVTMPFGCPAFIEKTDQIELRIVNEEEI